MYTKAEAVESKIIVPVMQKGMKPSYIVWLKLAEVSPIKNNKPVSK